MQAAENIRIRAEAAAREVFEEAGVEVRVRRLFGVYDNRTHALSGTHIFHIHKLLFLGELDLPSDFKPGGQTVEMNVDGWAYTFVLGPKGSYKDKQHRVQLRRSRNTWRLTLRTKRESHKSMRSAVNEDVVQRSVR